MAAFHLRSARPIATALALLALAPLLASAAVPAALTGAPEGGGDAEPSLVEGEIVQVDNPLFLDEDGDVATGALHMAAPLVMRPGNPVSFPGGDLTAEPALAFDGDRVCLAFAPIPGCASPGPDLAGAGLVARTSPALALDVAAGEGLLAGPDALAVDFAGSGVAGSAARSDHHHDARYVRTIAGASADATGDVDLVAGRGIAIATGLASVTIAAAPAFDVDCDKCVDARDVSVPYAKAATPGGPALDLACARCVTLDHVGFTPLTALEVGEGLKSAPGAQAGVVSIGLDDERVGARHLAPGAVTTGKIADGSVLASKLAEASVDEGKLAAGAVTDAKIAGGAVTSSKLADASVVAEKLADGSVGADKIGALAVTSGKIADAAVTGSKIADAAVTGVKLADAAVTGSKIADAAVTGSKIADAAITGSKIADAAVTGSKIADAAVTGVKLAPAAVTGSKIADSAVTAAKIADAAITGPKIAPSAVTATKIAPGAVSSLHVADGSIAPDDLSFRALRTLAGVGADANGNVAVIARNANFVVLADPGNSTVRLGIADALALDRVASRGGAFAVEFLSGEVANPLSQGEVVAVDATDPTKVVRATGAIAARAVGVVVGAPAFAASADPATAGGAGEVFVASTGRARVLARALTDTAPIAPGDLLVPGPAGTAVRCGDASGCPGRVIGKALEGTSSTVPALVWAIVSLG